MFERSKEFKISQLPELSIYKPASCMAMEDQLIGQLQRFFAGQLGRYFPYHMSTMSAKKSALMTIIDERLAEIAKTMIIPSIKLIPITNGYLSGLTMQDAMVQAELARTVIMLRPLVEMPDELIFIATENYPQLEGLMRQFAKKAGQDMAAYLKINIGKEVSNVLERLSAMEVDADLATGAKPAI